MSARIGLVSQGLVVRGLSEAVNQLLSRRYTCVIVDESHRARRRKVPKVDAGADEIDERAEPNKLMAFLREIGPKTKSMLLATATPATSSGRGLGSSAYSLPRKRWRARWLDADQPLVPTQPLSRHCHRRCDWSRTMMSVMAGNTSAIRCRPGLKILHSSASVRNLDAGDTRWQFNPESLDKLSPAIRRVQLQNGLLPDYGERFNPLLRCIVRRTRGYLEATINPATGSYFLPKVDREAVRRGRRRRPRSRWIPARSLSGGRGIFPAAPAKGERVRDFSRRFSCDASAVRWKPDAAPAASSSAKSPTSRMMRTTMTPKKKRHPSWTTAAGSQRFQGLHRRGNSITAPLPRAAQTRRQQRSQARSADRLSAWHPSGCHTPLARSGLHPLFAVLRHRPLGRR